MILSLLISCFFNLHPFHISVMEVEFDQENKSIEIAQKIFIDDLGDGLKMKHGTSLDLFTIDKDLEVQRKVEEYIFSKVAITINDKDSNYQYLGAEVDGDVLWVFLEVEEVKKLKSIKIRNEVLLSTFPDQMNLVHVKAFGTTRSLKLSKSKLENQISY